MSEDSSSDSVDDSKYTDPEESGLRSGRGPSLLGRLFGNF